MDKRVTTEDHSTVLEMLHQNSITQVPIYEADNENYWKFCPIEIDGTIKIVLLFHSILEQRFSLNSLLWKTVTLI